MPIRKDTTSYAQPVLGEKKDCSVRALSVAGAVPYGLAHSMFARVGRRNCQSTPTWVTAEVMRMVGATNLDVWRCGWPTLAQFIRAHPEGRYVLHRSRHAFALVDGVVHDWSTGTGPRSRIVAAWRLPNPEGL